VFERFVDDTWDEEGVLWLLVCWFGSGPEDDTWQYSRRQPVAAVYQYYRRKGLLPQDPDKAEPGRDQGLWNQAFFVAVAYIPHPLTCTLD